MTTTKTEWVVGSVQQEFNNMVTIHTIAYNEELMIEFFINHYRGRFPNCNIIVYDNESTDSTVEIAKKHHCKVITYSTDNTLSDQKYLDIKNNCWKDSDTDWNVVCDCDELIDVTENDLLKEESLGTNCFRFEGYSMMNNSNEIDIPSMKYGFRDPHFDKNFLFNKKYLSEINYAPGCHTSNPKARFFKKLIFSEKKYIALHYKYLSPQHTVNRHMLYSKRLSEDNKRKGWGEQYSYVESVIGFYEKQKDKLIEIK